MEYFQDWILALKIDTVEAQNSRRKRNGAWRVQKMRGGVVPPWSWYGQFYWPYLRRFAVSIDGPGVEYEKASATNESLSKIESKYLLTIEWFDLYFS